MKRKKTLIFYGEGIGDTLVFLPAITMICQSHSDSDIYLYNVTTGNSLTHQDFFEHQLTFKKAVFRKAETGFSFSSIRNKIKHFFELYSIGFDQGFFLTLRLDTPFLEKIVFLYLLRIKKCFFFQMPESGTRIGDDLIEQLTRWGFCPKEKSPTGLLLTAEEKQRAETAFRQIDIGDRIPIAVGIGGKKDSCLWPVERYTEVLRYGVGKYHLFPVFYGGPADGPAVKTIIGKIGTGIFSLDTPLRYLTLREQVASMACCSFYLGNDTGTMHMANAAGIPCIVLFSNMALFRSWFPHGENNICLIHRQPCEACNEITCPYGSPSKCILEISVDEVKNAIDQIVLNQNMGKG